MHITPHHLNTTIFHFPHFINTIQHLTCKTIIQQVHNTFTSKIQQLAINSIKNWQIAHNGPNEFVTKNNWGTRTIEVLDLDNMHYIVVVVIMKVLSHHKTLANNRDIINIVQYVNAIKNLFTFLADDYPYLLYIIVTCKKSKYFTKESLLNHNSTWILLINDVPIITIHFNTFWTNEFIAFKTKWIKTTYDLQLQANRQKIQAIHWKNAVQLQKRRVYGVFTRNMV